MVATEHRARDLAAMLKALSAPRGEVAQRFRDRGCGSGEESLLEKVSTMVLTSRVGRELAKEPAEPRAGLVQAISAECKPVIAAALGLMRWGGGPGGKDLPAKAATIAANEAAARELAKLEQNADTKLQKCLPWETEVPTKKVWAAMMRRIACATWWRRSRGRSGCGS